jgi:hypothetical protein
MRDAFARRGYIVVPDVLNQQQLDELNQVYDQHILEREDTLSTARTDKQNRFYIGGRDQRKTTDRHGNTCPGRRFWSKAYKDLIDNETMLPIMEEILGGPSWGHAPAHMPAELRPLPQESCTRIVTYPLACLRNEDMMKYGLKTYVIIASIYIGIIYFCVQDMIASEENYL